MSVEPIREVSYAVPDDGFGHLAEMRVDPIGLFHRVREECGGPEVRPLAGGRTEDLEPHPHHDTTVPISPPRGLTRTASSPPVGWFCPTSSGRTGSSRWPRSTTPASCTARGRP